MKWESVLAWRMQRQHLTARAADPLAVVSDICGLHAQVLSSAQLTLWARMEDPPDVSDLLWRDRSLVKTWAQRGTLHLHRTDELPLWVGAQAALKPRYETEVVAQALQAQRAGRQGDHRGRPGGAARRARRPARSWRAVHPGLARGYGDLLKPVAFRGELIYAEDGRFALPGAVRAAWTPRPRRRRSRAASSPATARPPARSWRSGSGTRRPRRPGKWFPADEVVETEFGLGAGGGRGGDRGGRAGGSRAAAARVRPVRRRRAARRAGDDPPRSASTAPAAGSRPSCSSTA